MRAQAFVRNFVSPFAAFLLLAGQSAPGSAEPVEPAAVTVSYGDLDLSVPAGAERLYKRIDQTAKQVCGSPTLANSAIVAPGYKACVVEAVDRAVATVDSPLLSAYHAARTAKPARAIERVASANTGNSAYRQ
jgi:UrcA family protein